MLPNTMETRQFALFKPTIYSLSKSIYDIKIGRFVKILALVKRKIVIFLKFFCMDFGLAFSCLKTRFKIA